MSTKNRNPQTKKPSTPEQAAVQPSGPRGDNPSTAGPGQTAVHFNTPENRLEHLNPSAPKI